jgi:Ca2+-binding RTX toxin-like protein
MIHMTNYVARANRGGAGRPTDGLVFGDNQVINRGDENNDDSLLGENNTLNAGGGDDKLRAEEGANNVLNGEAGNDFMRGHIGDTFNGGADFDDALIDLSSDSAGVTANLQDIASGSGVAFGGVAVSNTEKAGIVFGSGADQITTGSAATFAIYAGDGADTLVGGTGGELLAGGLAADQIFGGAGADKLWGFGPINFADYPSFGFNDFDDGLVGDRLYGGAGDDTLSASMGADTLNGGDGEDTASYENLDDGGSIDGVTVKLGKAVQDTGGSGSDRFVSIENVYGSGNADTLYGDDGDNVINGNRGADTIRGGLGADTLTGGDTNGADVFVYRSVDDSTTDDFDVITDFNFADRLYLRPIDANETKDGNQAFTVVDAFTNAAGQLVRTYDSVANETTVLLDTDGDSRADAKIVISGDIPDDYFIL